MTYIVYLSKLASDSLPGLCSLARTIVMGRFSLSTPCRMLFPMCNWAVKSAASFFAVPSPVWLRFKKPSSPTLIMSLSTFISLFRHWKALTIMTSASCTFHFRARKKRSSTPSGSSCLRLSQNDLRSASLLWLARIFLNSVEDPYLSFTASLLPGSGEFLPPFNHDMRLFFFSDFGVSVPEPVFWNEEMELARETV